jgi:hypothetical protein
MKKKLIRSCIWSVAVCGWGTVVAQWLRCCATNGDRGSTVVKVLCYSGTTVAQRLRCCVTNGDRGSTEVKVLCYRWGPR